MKSCQDLPGQELFQYVDEAGERRTVRSQDVNAYLRALSGEAFSAKDFRTWAGTVLAALALHEFEDVDSPTTAKRNVTRAITYVSARLGNTAAICRKCYVHPEVLSAYLEGTLTELFQKNPTAGLPAEGKQLEEEEAAVLTFLERRLGKEGDRDEGSPLPKSAPGDNQSNLQKSNF